MKWSVFGVMCMTLFVLLAIGTPTEWGKELEVISQAPYIFWGAFIFLYLLVITPSIFFFKSQAEKRYSGKIDTLEQQVQLSKDRLDAKSEKISEQAETISKLEKQVSKSSNDEQKAKDSELNEEMISLLSLLAKFNSESPQKNNTKIENGIYSVEIKDLKNGFIRHPLDELINMDLCRLQGGTLRGLAWNEGYKDNERVYLTPKGISMIEDINKRE